MTPAEFETHAIAAIERMLARGSRIVAGTWGDSTCGCALTLVAADAGHRVWALFPGHDAWILDALVEGFDDPYMLGAGEWHAIGRRLRARFLGDET